MWQDSVFRGSGVALDPSCKTKHLFEVGKRCAEVAAIHLSLILVCVKLFTESSSSPESVGYRA